MLCRGHQRRVHVLGTQRALSWSASSLFFASKVDPARAVGTEVQDSPSRRLRHSVRGSTPSFCIRMRIQESALEATLHSRRPEGRARSGELPVPWRSRRLCRTHNLAITRGRDRVRGGYCDRGIAKARSATRPKTRRRESDHALNAEPPRSA